MFRLLRQWFISYSPTGSQSASKPRPRRSRQRWQRRSLVWILCLLSVAVGVSALPSLVTAQTTIQQRENNLIREFAQPKPPRQAPVYRPQPRPAAPSRPAAAPRAADPSPRPSAPNPAPSPRPAASETPAPRASAPAPQTYQYVLNFNRSPVVGSRLRLQGVYPEARLGFTRPRGWQVKGAKVVLRFQHSPSLLANRSNLMVRVNNTSIGSVPLSYARSKVGQVTFDVPANLLSDYNELSILAEQQTSETCTIPTDPTLWTEILPDSKIMLDFSPQTIPLDFSRYPYPFIDELSLEPNQLTYLRPKTYSDTWINAAASLQTKAGRTVDFRPLNTRLVSDLENLKWNDRLIVIGTPAEQPLLRQLNLPYTIQNGRILDGEGAPLPPDVGLLMLTSVEDSGVPVMVVTGNATDGVLKAVQFLAQTEDTQIGTGQAVVVTSLSDVSAPAARDWPGYLPSRNSFALRDLTMANGQPYEDTTVHGTNAPPVQIPFKALPDDRFSRGGSIKVEYSYSSQVDPRTSTVEVQIDDVTIGSRRLTSSGGGRESFHVDIPDNVVKPDSMLNVVFNLNPRSSEVCGLSKDQSLWGTLHGDSNVNLKRDIFVQLPDLKLLQTGYPFTAPQDLSETAVVLPSNPKDLDIQALLAFSERMGRLSKADTVRMQVYTAGTLPAEARDLNLVAIGTRDRFPLPEALQSGGLGLGKLFTREFAGSEVQTLPDQEGVLKMTLSSENRERVVLALTGQTEQGLQDVVEIFKQDALFLQLQGDTVLISRNPPSPAPYDPPTYNLNVLREVPTERIQKTGLLSQISLLIQDYWFMLPTGFILLALVLYGVSQIFVNRLEKSGEMK